MHRTEEIFAQNGQLESILIPCAAHAQPLPHYQWYWIPFGVQFNWETEIASLLLKQQQKPKVRQGSTSSTTVNTFAVPIPIQSTGNNGDNQNEDESLLRQLTRRHQMSLSRLRSFGSTLLIPGPISQTNAGHYVAIVTSSVGYDRCITTVNVRSPLSVRIIQGDSHNSSVVDTANKPVIRAIRGDRLQLRCVVSGFPLTDVYWLHNTQPVGGSGAVSGVVSPSNAAVPVNQQLVSTNNFYYHYNHYETHIGEPNSSPLKSLLNVYSGPSGSSPSLVDISAIKQLTLQLDEQTRSGMYQCFANNRFEVVQSAVQIQVIGKFPYKNCIFSFENYSVNNSVF